MCSPHYLTLQNLRRRKNNAKKPQPYGERCFQNLGRNCTPLLHRLGYILSQITTVTYTEYSYVGLRFSVMKVFYLLGYNAVQPVESQPTFRRNMSPSSWGSNRSSEKPASSACQLLLRCFIARLILQSWRWRRHVSPKRRLTFNGVHGVISQKTELLREYSSFPQRSGRLWTPSNLLPNASRCLLSWCKAAGAWSW
jgi:hypothetical protein